MGEYFSCKEKQIPMELSLKSNEFGRVLLVKPSMFGKLEVHASEVMWRFEPITFHIGELRVKLILATHAPQACQTWKVLPITPYQTHLS